MRPTVRVRVAEPADLGELVRITEAAAVPPPRGHQFPDRVERYTGLLADPDSIVLAAVDEHTDRLVGVLVAHEDDVGSLVPVPAVIVTHLVVELAHRRRGAGRALLAGVVRQAEDRGIDQIVVSVAMNDRDANRYLARLGFAPLVVRRICAVGALRRKLGMGDLLDPTSARRRRRVQAMVPVRAIGRGA